MEILDLELEGLKLIKPKIIPDERGYFLESYRKDKLTENGIDIDFIQDNHSFSSKNTIRGMHFQKNPGQDKLISVISGKIFDVAVDIRKDSKTFGKWIGVYLDDVSCYQLLIPKGFAHGFCVVSETVHVLYKVSNIYIPEKEKGFYWNDSTIGIKWPVSKPILSKRDLNAPTFREMLLDEVVT